MKVLGSVYFAIVLIALTLLFVIAGTILESWSGSHLYAAYFTYNNPVFQLLLWLYFLNILCATLKRYPFQRKHIPFIITHLGLLMLLAGVLWKSYFGVQGATAVTEGSGTEHIFVPHSYALLIEDRETRHVLPLKQHMEAEKLSIKLLEWTDHAEEHLEGFIKGSAGHIVGLPPFEVDGAPLLTTHYTIHAVSDPDTITFPGAPSLFFARDVLVAFNELGERFTHSFDGQAFYIFDKGYGGYGIFAELPEHFPPIELIAPLTRNSKAVPSHRKKEELTPRIRLLVSDDTDTEIATLTFDKFATGFKWPVLKGKYLLRFQSLERTIPHHIRLRQARQINYPETNKPYSFESDLIIGGEETTISMNHVFEKKGYRFYLANLVTPPMSAVRAQIVVNYDPAKYTLTYPGGILLALGMLLLYLQKRYA